MTKSNTMGRWGAALGLALVFAVAPAAHRAGAQATTDDERARSHFLAGSSYFDQRRFDDAAEQFQEAFRLSGRIALLLNVGTAYERAGRFAEAVATLEQYLESAPADDPQRRTLETRLDSLREEAAEQERQRAEAAAAEAERAAEDAAPEAPVAEQAPPPATEDDGGMSGLGIAGYAVGGAGVAAGVVSLATGLVAHGRFADLEAACGPDRVCPPALEADADSGRRLAAVSTATTFVGIAGVATGVVLIVLDAVSGDDGDDGETASFHLVPGPGDFGLALEASFR